ncbi:hypothetical protein ABE41_017640 [Fictibacillus arsenicus]|jgi:hypothetical protein|uniref:Uncharacterized protein n=1 Tax=Fictibacillus arsenicus TaxID=255247 RepID=A0A1B1Z8Q4_9BACL|nr:MULTISPECIES: hypothetical protein [Fictibacillus]ANX13837.1 hypothetical protein ABE41_017640 [Fictibacillus arsenicus]MCM3733494.1 hypothetical protein [Fictibacillus nanhaiensis]
MGKYIILTNKDTYQTTIESKGLEPVETYDFIFFEEIKASYTIAKVTDDSIKIRLYEKYEGKEFVNEIRVKFFESFETVEDARAELDEMVAASGSGPDSKYTKLVLRESTAV